MENQTVHEGKTIAIISYITFIGTIIAFIMNNAKHNSFASFHIRQTIGLALCSLVNTFIIGRYADPWVGKFIGIGLFILWIIGLIGATQSKEKRIPFVGDSFQDWFKNIG